MTKNETVSYKLTVKEFEPDNDIPRTFLCCEPTNREFSFLEGKGFLSLHLKPGHDVHRAKEIARFIEENVERFGVTFFR
jgi:hypothetical protein